MVRNFSGLVAVDGIFLADHAGLSPFYAKVQQALLEGDLCRWSLFAHSAGSRGIGAQSTRQNACVTHLEDDLLQQAVTPHVFAG
eukprot:4756983-Amphidinium_carterae.7